MTGITNSVSGRVGYIGLDQPKRLNALTYPMIEALYNALQLHEQNDKVEVIVLRSTSDRAFCAGGDMRATRDLALQENWQALYDFFEQEYALNLSIAKCSKPYLSLINGIAMGGGLGLSVHGSHRIVAEKAVMAMPETAIGFFPDVGGTYFLSRLQHKAGWWLGLGGMSINAQQAVIVGLATHYISAVHWPELLGNLEQHGAEVMDQVLGRLSVDAADTAFEKQLLMRKKWFPGESFDDMVEHLKTQSSKDRDAAGILKSIQTKSPMALRLTWDLLSSAESMNLPACLAAELVAGEKAVRHADFAEGIRAVLVDKDHQPKWSST